MRSLVVSILLAAACGDNGASPDARPHVDAALQPDASTVQTIELTGGANALLWDAPAQTLYLTDSNALALLKWTQAGGVAKVSDYPPPPVFSPAIGFSPSAMVKRHDGVILTANFGFGKDGAIFATDTSGTTTKLTGLDVALKYIGLDQDQSGNLYINYFTGNTATAVGGIAAVDVNLGAHTAAATEIAGASTAAGFKKLVGLVANTDFIYVSDQTGNAVYRVSPAGAVSKLADITAPDLLLQLPNGDLVTGGGTTIRRISPEGVVTSLDTPATFELIHGLAFDAATNRLFAIDHSTSAGTKDLLHVIQLPAE